MATTREQLIEKLQATTESLLGAGRGAMNGHPMTQQQAASCLATAAEAMRVLALARAELEMEGYEDWDSPPPYPTAKAA